MGQKSSFPITTKLAAKADVGLGNVDNTSDANKPVSTAQAAADAAVTAAAALALASHAAAATAHTKAQVGLGSVDNTADADKPVSTAQAAADAAVAAAAASALATQAASTTAALALKANDAATTAALALKAPSDSATFTTFLRGPTIADLAANGLDVVNTAHLQSQLAVRARFGSGAPSNGMGFDGDAYIRVDKPFAGVVYVKAAGIWNTLDNSYTFATLPAAGSTYLGAVVTVSDWKCQFECIQLAATGTYHWIPVTRNLCAFANRDFAPSALTAGTGALQVQQSYTTPAGIIVPGCELTFRQGWEWGGATAIKTMLVKNATSGDAILNRASAAAANVGSSNQVFVQVSSSSAAAERYLTNSVTDNGFNQGTTSFNSSTAWNLAAATAWQWGATVNAADTSRMVHASLDIKYP